MENIAKKLEKVFLYFLFINPFLDIISGVYLSFAASLGLPSVTPSLLVRMGMLLLFAAYIVMRRDQRAVLLMLPVAAAWLLSALGEYLFFYAFSLYEDAAYMARFVYNLAVIPVYSLLCRRGVMSRDTLVSWFERAMVTAALVLSSSIVLSFALGIGQSTYGDRFGYRGSKGFFYSANDITAALMLLLPITFCALFKLKKKTPLWKKLLCELTPAFTVTALLLIGTKTAFIAAIVTGAVMAVYSVGVLITKKSSLVLKRFIIADLLFAAVFLALTFTPSSNAVAVVSESFAQPATVQGDTGLINTIFSGRQYKLAKAFKLWKESLPYSAAFGIGRGTQQKIIEMDLCEVFFYYGLFGTVAMLWLYLRSGVSFVGKFFRRFDMTGLACFVSLGLSVVYMIMAGHVLFSVTSGFYFSLILVYAHLNYVQEPSELKLY